MFVAPYISFIIADLLVEVFAFQAQEVLAGLQDSTLCSDGTGCVNVVSGDHADCDARSLAFRNSLGNLRDKGQN